MTLFEQLGAAINPKKERFTIYKPGYITKDGIEIEEKTVLILEDEQLAKKMLKEYAKKTYDFCLVRETSYIVYDERIGWEMDNEYGTKFFDDL